MNNSIGFIGLGNMGLGMAKNLAGSGFSILGFDVDPTKYDNLKTDNFKCTAAIEEVAKNCETVIVCLPHPDVSHHVIFDELLANGSTIKSIVETSTLTPETVLDFSNKLSDLHINFLSAPMIGGKNSAIDKTILFLVEGEEELFGKFQVIFQAMGNQAAYMGKAPSTTLAKLAFNLSRYANLAVGMETYRLLQAYGANTKAIYEFMSEQSLDNFGQVWREDLKETMTESIPFKPSQVPKKDLQLLAEMADGRDLDAELIQAIKNTYISME